MVLEDEKQPSIKVAKSYSTMTLYQQLSWLARRPAEFAKERKGYGELSRLIVPLILVSLMVSLIIVPTIAYMELRNDVASKYYEHIGYSMLSDIPVEEEAAAEREITTITINTIRYLLSENWIAAIIGGLIIIPLYAILLLIYFLVRGLVRYTYIKILGGKGSMARHLTLEAYSTILWSIIGTIILLLAMMLVYFGRGIGAIVLLLIVIGVTLWNWNVYVKSLASLHSMKTIKTFFVLFIPIALFVILTALYYIMLLGIAARMLTALGA
ncbi:MAG: YIP1 family protein [Candidatus Woesearchaeota archaeon]